MYVWSLRFQCRDFVQCVAQNGSDFGVFPITDQLTYQGSYTHNTFVADIFDLHKKLGIPINLFFWAVGFPLKVNLTLQCG